MRRGLALQLALALGTLTFASGASGSTITLSGISSDATPASQLDATLQFEVGEFDAGNAGDELRLTLTNPAAGGDNDGLFNINRIYWNGSDAVTGLMLLSATHSVANDVTADWNPVVLGANADGFGAFDFALIDGVGEMNTAIAEPGESVVFILDIDGAGVTMADFVEPNDGGFLAAAKFVNGPDDPESPGNEDSAFGTVVPEPSAALLFPIGLAIFAAVRSRR